MKLTQKIQILLLGLMVMSPTIYPMVRSWLGYIPGEYTNAGWVLAGMAVWGLAAWVNNNFELKKKK